MMEIKENQTVMKEDMKALKENMKEQMQLVKQEVGHNFVVFENIFKQYMHKIDTTCHRLQSYEII